MRVLRNNGVNLYPRTPHGHPCSMIGRFLHASQRMAVLSIARLKTCEAIMVELETLTASLPACAAESATDHSKT